MKIKTSWWMSRETGELLRYAEMVAQGRELYDLDEGTNLLEYSEYYEQVGA